MIPPGIIPTKAELQAEIDRLRADLAALRDELGMYKGMLHRSQREASDAIDARDAMRDPVIEQLRAERAALRAEVTALKQRIADDNKAYGCELRDPAGTIWDHAAQLQREVARLQMELDSTCNAEELRQTRAENAALQDRAQRSELVASDRDFQLAERLRLERELAALLSAGNEMARIIDIPGDAPIERWASEAEIDAALKAWRAALAKGGAK